MAKQLTRKLGRRRPPSNKVAIPFKDIWTGVVPPHPVSADHFALVTDWGMYDNDKFGVCGPTYVANLIKLETKYLTGKEISPTLDDVFQLYRDSGNPDFDPVTGAGDNGVDMQIMLEAFNKIGIGGIKCIAFAKVNVSNPDELKAAEAIFGALGYGVNLEVAQKKQTDKRLWDYVPSANWGGHAVLSGRYTTIPDLMGLISWSLIVDATAAFIKHQLEEAWVVILKENLATAQFIQGIDLAKLAEYYQSLTHRPLPVPTPTPVPPGDGCLKIVVDGFRGIAVNPNLNDKRVARAFKLAAADLEKSK